MWYDFLLANRLVSDSVLRKAIHKKLARKLEKETCATPEEQEKKFEAYVQELKESPIAICTEDANQQHYELPSEFFFTVLGKRLKYSSCYYKEGVNDLDQAEIDMLEMYVERAQLGDGQAVLDMGCGWGSFSLYAAEKFPNSKFTAVSNSRTQKEFIDGRAISLGLQNLEVITCDMNDFEAPGQFDRVISIEMFEHMRNYEALFKKVASWLKPDGLVFLHVFCHEFLAYPYIKESKDDWMAQYFFSGGQMPSFHLFDQFSRDLKVSEKWRVNGVHYQKTLEAWLVKMDQAEEKVMPLMKETYGKGASLWWMRWRIFFIACAELFGYREGQEWYVGHYLLKKSSS